MFSVSSGCFTLFVIANGYTNMLNTKHIATARIKQKIEIKPPNIHKANLTVKSQIIPSRSRLKIKPGILILQDDIVSNKSPIKLFFRNKQDKNGKNNAEPIDAPITAPVPAFAESVIISARATARAVNRPPHKKERFRCNKP